MIYRSLGRTGLNVSIMGMGTGGASDPLGQQSGRPEAENYRLICRAFELGINLFDTAPGYMESEVILGRALQTLARDRVVVSTKIPLAGGMPGQPMKIMSAAEIEPAVERSLKRLQVTYLDLLLVGIAGPEHHERFVAEQLPVLVRLKESGKVRFLGSSEQSRSDGSHEWLKRVLPDGALDVAMVAHNMINQSAQHSVLPVCRALNLGVINVFTVRKVFSDRRRLQQVVQDLKSRGIIDSDAVPNEGPLDWLVDGKNVASISEAAYRYAAYTEGITSVMNGASDIPRLEQNVRSVLQGPLPPESIQRLRAIFGKVAEPIGN
jgi:L-galactose dehydrogenase